MNALAGKSVENNEAINFDLVRISKSKERCDLSPNTIRAFAEQGLRLFKHGKMIFFSRSELEQFIRTKSELKANGGQS
jgi:hypothetical protein